MDKPSEFFISVDVETSGPNPSSFSMLSIGACTLRKPQSSFYIEIQPINENVNSEALQISGLDWEKLQKEGIPPINAMAEFASWIQDVTPDGMQPIFLAFNAVFDWMFINDYFHRYYGNNPFGYKALDIKAFYMGFHRVSWEETTMRYVSSRYLDDRSLPHHALKDAYDQAEIFRKMLDQAKDIQKGE